MLTKYTAKVFARAAKEMLAGKSAGWRREQIASLLAKNYKGYLTSKALHFAQDHRDMGYDISDETVREILNTKDGFYCGHMAPLNFAEYSFENSQIALVSVRETVRERLGIGLPRMTVKESKNLKLESL
ncbi:MAG TPA: hypothetical protein VFS88_03125 [Micavibrio sp.]|nr:hypothetical protein [Micavibrio sp.]